MGGEKAGAPPKNTSSFLVTKGALMPSGSGRASNNVLYITALLFVVVLCVACPVISFHPPLKPTSTAPPTTTPTASPTNTPTPFASPPPTATFLPDVEVIKWHPVYICRGKIAVEVNIVGVEVRGGVPPFEIEAHYKNGTALPRRFATEDTDPLTLYKLRVEPPLTFNTDMRVVVTMKSNSPTGLPKWSGELYYPPDAKECNRE